ncbi:MAG: FeoA family protein [Pyrinomonadaceae bacterium]|nr:ferrous iron transport protein A [Blastocatellia bacterium]MDQ3220275.1 ferrous iron transport protein A [Acidobacteriota bacterium]MDQ3490344.1 ferrous iron transport protein A [Acidobacteriota bacterium]
MTLNMLKAGRTATVKGIYSKDTERRRMVDLGILPGTLIENVMASPLGDPVAYRIRSAVIALRREQAELIEVEEEG